MTNRDKTYEPDLIGYSLYSTTEPHHGLIVDTDVETEGGWTGPIVSNIDGGGVQLSLGTGDEAPAGHVALTWGNILSIPVRDLVKVEFDLRAAGLTADTPILVGMVDDFQEANDDFLYGAWFTNTYEDDTSYLTVVARDAGYANFSYSVPTNIPITDDDWIACRIDCSRGPTDIIFHATNQNRIQPICRETDFSLAHSGGLNTQLCVKVQSTNAGDEPTLYLRHLKITYR